MDNNLRELLLRQARLHRMCRENLDALRLCETKSDAIALYKKTIDWALESNYPDINVIRRFFADCQQEGVYVDKRFAGEVLADQQVYVLHHCSGTIYVDLNIKKKIIPMIYLANDCDITIKRKSTAGVLPIKVPIYSFGENVVITNNTENVEFHIFKFYD